MAENQMRRKSKSTGGRAPVRVNAVVEPIVTHDDIIGLTTWDSTTWNSDRPFRSLQVYYTSPVVPVLSDGNGVKVGAENSDTGKDGEGVTGGGGLVEEGGLNDEEKIGEERAKIARHLRRIFGSKDEWRDRLDVYFLPIPTSSSPNTTSSSTSTSISTTVFGPKSEKEREDEAIAKICIEHQKREIAFQEETKGRFMQKWDMGWGTNEYRRFLMVVDERIDVDCLDENGKRWGEDAVKGWIFDGDFKGERASRNTSILVFWDVIDRPRDEDELPAGCTSYPEICVWRRSVDGDGGGRGPSISEVRSSINWQWLSDREVWDVDGRFLGWLEEGDKDAWEFIGDEDYLDCLDDEKEEGEVDGEDGMVRSLDE